MASSSTSMQTTRTAMFHGVGDLRIGEVAARPVGPGQIALRPEFCGICGSDLHFFFEEWMANTLKVAHPLTGEALPVPFGHEFAGVITELGSENLTDGSTAKHKLAVGDRVAIMPVLSDGDCFACRAGSHNVCSQVGFLGINGQAGGMSDRAVVPTKHVFKLPNTIPNHIGALVEPLAVAWHGLDRVPAQDLTAGSSSLILGGGPVGCGVLLCLLARGVTDIVLSEPTEGRREFCKQFGNVTTCAPEALGEIVAGRTSAGKIGFDAAFDCAGVATSLATAAQHVRAKGTVVGLALQVSAVVPAAAMMMKEARLEFSLAYTSLEFEAVIAAIEQGRIKPEAMITKRIALKDVVKDGLEVLKSKGNAECKILIDLSK